MCYVSFDNGPNFDGSVQEMVCCPSRFARSHPDPPTFSPHASMPYLTAIFSFLRPVAPKVWACASDNGSNCTRPRSLETPLVVEPAHEVLDTLSSLSGPSIMQRENSKANFVLRVLYPRLSVADRCLHPRTEYVVSRTLGVFGCLLSGLLSVWGGGLRQSKKLTSDLMLLSGHCRNTLCHTGRFTGPCFSGLVVEESTSKGG